MFDEILFALGIKESDLYDNFIGNKDEYYTNDELSVTNAKEDTLEYNVKSEKTNNKDKTILEQAEALKLVNEHVGKLLDAAS